MALTAPIPNWPLDFPCPQIEGYGAEIYSAVVRTPFEGGNTRQRRIHNQIPHAIRLSWVFKHKQEWGMVLNWVNINGYNWFTIPIPTALSSLKGTVNTDTTIRFISDMQTEIFEAADGFYWRMAVTAEWMPSDSDFGVGGAVFFSGKWIIADSTGLAAPAPDWIIAGTAPAPNSGTTIKAGTPTTPAALV